MIATYTTPPTATNPAKVVSAVSSPTNIPLLDFFFSPEPAPSAASSSPPPPKIPPMILPIIPPKPDNPVANISLIYCIRFPDLNASNSSLNLLDNVSANSSILAIPPGLPNHAVKSPNIPATLSNNPELIRASIILFFVCCKIRSKSAVAFDLDFSASNCACCAFVKSLPAFFIPMISITALPTSLPNAANVENCCFCASLRLSAASAVFLISAINSSCVTVPSFNPADIFARLGFKRIKSCPIAFNGTPPVATISVIASFKSGLAESIIVRTPFRFLCADSSMVLKISFRRLSAILSFISSMI